MYLLYLFKVVALFEAIFLLNHRNIKEQTTFIDYFTVPEGVQKNSALNRIVNLYYFQYLISPSISHTFSAEFSQYELRGSL